MVKGVTIMKLFMSFLLLITLSACSSLQRSTQYDTAMQSQYMTAQDIKENQISKYELGLHRLTRPLTKEEYDRLALRNEVKRLERRLVSSLEKELYYKNKAFFKSDYERIEFLRIADYSDRLKWLARNSFQQRLSSYTSEENEAIEQNDILLHMSMRAVRESWGEPDAREISGSELHGNERWVYHNYQATSEGYKKEDRIIFFQNGRVIAWRTK
jgi:hypothetical protein